MNTRPRSAPRASPALRLARQAWKLLHIDSARVIVLALRDEGLALLRHEQRGFLLNTIAGCYSARNQSEQAFAYMYQALRDAPPARAARSLPCSSAGVSRR